MAASTKVLIQTPMTTAADTKNTPFEDDFKEVLQELRTSLSELLTAVGADPTRPQDVSRLLGVNKNLTWKVSKIIREPDPSAVVPQIPGKGGFRILFRAARKCGAPLELIELAEQALGRFDELVDTHSGDRDTLELMAGHLSREIDPARAEAERKLAFRGNSAIWGVQARLQLCVNFLFPSDDPDWANLGWISGLVDFRRLRGDVCWTIASARKADDEGALLPLGEIEPLDAEFSDPHLAPLLGNWCSKPMPPIRADHGPDGMVRYQLVEGPIGNTAAATCFIGIIGRKFVRRTRTEGDTIGEHNVRLYTPAELVVHDLLVHRDLAYAMEPEALLYSQMPNLPSYPQGGREQGLLPLPERVLDLGSSPPDLVLPELPQYRRMIRSVFEEKGLELSDFRGFRLRMKFPPIPTLAVLRYELP